MGYFRLYLLLLISLFLVGCGNSLENFVMANGGDATEATPAGVVIHSGTGPVLDGEEAFLRVSSQYLGLNVPNRAVRARTGAAVVGTQTDPLLNLYQLAETAIPRGAVVGPVDESSPSFTLPSGYFIFWVDPNPPAKRGHRCSLLFLRQRDGRMIEQEVDFDPIVDGNQVLGLPSQQLANLCYTHQEWVDRGLSPLSSPLPAQRIPKVRAQGVGQAGGPMTTAVGVVGAPDDIFDADMDRFSDYFEGVGGDPVDFYPYSDTEKFRVNETELVQTIIDANVLLGPDDKFFFFLTSHGSSTGSFRFGPGKMTWERLCEILDENVKAGNLNIVIDTCYGGLAVPVFEKWAASSDKRVRLVSATDHNSKSYVNVNLPCLLKELLELAMAASGDGELSLDELEQTFLDAMVPKEELEAKLFATPLPSWRLMTYLENPTSGPVSTGFDERPKVESPIIDAINEFFENWAQAVSDEDQAGLTPSYPANYFYNGQDRQQVTNFAGGFDINIPVQFSLSLDLADLLATRRLEYDVTVAGILPIEQHEERDMIFRLHAREAGLDPAFEILTQRTISQSTTGTIGTDHPAIPSAPTLTGALAGMDGMVTQPGNILPVQATVTGLFDGSNPNEQGSVGAALGGQIFTMQPAGGGVFEGTITVPSLANGLYVLEVFCENRRLQGSAQAYAGKSQTAEIEVEAP